MIFPNSEFIVSLFLLFSLVLMAKLRDQILLEDKESFRHIFGGLAILAVVTVSKVYSGIGVFDQIPFISDPLFYKILYWIGIITGVSFLISGVSNWLPLSQANRKYNRGRIRQLELLRKVEQLIHVENRCEQVLRKTIEYMVEYYDLQYGAVYGLMSETGKMNLISSSGVSESIEQCLSKMTFDIDRLQKMDDVNHSTLSQFIEQMSDNTTPPNLVLSLVVENRIHGVFLLWATKDSILDDEARINFKIAVDIIARKITIDNYESSRAIHQQCDNWIDSIVKEIDYQKDLSENIIGISRCVIKMIPAKLVSLTILDEQKTVSQLSIGETRNVLNEVALDLNAVSSHVKQAFMTGQSQYREVNDKTVPQTKADEMLNRSAMISLAAIPLEYRGKVRGVFHVASRHAGGYIDRDRKILKSIAPILRNLLAEEFYRNDLNKRERRATSINSFLNEAGSEKDLHKIFERAADILSTELKCSLVRIATFDRDGAFLSSRALTMQRQAKPITPSNGHMILSLMPYHRLVRDTGRMMLINQHNTEKKMSPAEARQLFSEDLQSALVVPIKIDQKVLGVISSSDTREWNQYRYHHADLSFVSSIAAILAMAIQTRLGVTAGSFADEEQIDPVSRTGDLEPSMESRIKSSLSGIVESVAVIKSQPRSGDEALEQYLSIIDKSARRIGECFVEDKLQL